jgi:hypothetical protein
MQAGQTTECRKTAARSRTRRPHPLDPQPCINLHERPTSSRILPSTKRGPWTHDGNGHRHGEHLRHVSTGLADSRLHRRPANHRSAAHIRAQRTTALRTGPDPGALPGALHETRATLLEDGRPPQQWRSTLGQRPADARRLYILLCGGGILVFAASTLIPCFHF